MQRILRRLTEDPSLLEETPAEIIDRRVAGMIDDHEMMERLLNWKYAFGGVVRIDGVATDAYTTGDWDDIEMAFYRGLLSDEEFQRLATRHLKSMAVARDDSLRAKVAEQLTTRSAAGGPLHRDAAECTERRYATDVSRVVLHKRIVDRYLARGNPGGDGRSAIITAGAQPLADRCLYR